MDYPGPTDVRFVPRGWPPACFAALLEDIGSREYPSGIRFVNPDRAEALLEYAEMLRVCLVQEAPTTPTTADVKTEPPAAELTTLAGPATDSRGRKLSDLPRF